MNATEALIGRELLYSMTASDCVIAWGEVNIILSACMKENARAT